MIEQQANDAKDKIEGVKVSPIESNSNEQEKYFNRSISLRFLRKLFNKNIFHLLMSMHQINHVLFEIAS